MANRRRIFTQEFKVEAVKLLTENGYSIPEAARSLGIGQTILRNWKKTLEKEGIQGFPEHGNPPAFEAELRRLQAENSGLFSRRVVGWSMADNLGSRLVVDALDMAISRRLPHPGLMAHGDRGSQYASEHYQQLLGKYGIQCSRSGVGQCWDNAPMESFLPV